MTEQHARALFLLAGLEVKATHELANGYMKDRKDPWWLVETTHGLIKLGWRSHVIQITWETIALRAIVTKDDVTKAQDMVHAWSYGKAVEYLTELRFQLERAARLAAKSKEQPTDPEASS